MLPRWASAGETASGFGPGATPAERQLAERPEPDALFREMTGFWHGVPGLDALRMRWEGFAKHDQGFAVLAALISESEGKPGEALEKLRLLTGSDARWNEGRLLALLGREAEAVAVLSPMPTMAEHPNMGAAALIALTELDCIRGDFAKALERTTAAWNTRPEEGFRLSILERHLSLLVEAGQEKDFLEEQIALAKKTVDPPTAQTAQRVMFVMADWFTADRRLRSAQEQLKPTYSTGVSKSIRGLGRRAGTLGRSTLNCGLLILRGTALAKLGQDALASTESAGALAYQIAFSRHWPDSLDGLPLLKRALSAEPLKLSRMLFSTADPSAPLAPLARKLVDGLDPGVERRTLDLIERSRAGHAVPEDAETLAAIIVEAPQLRLRRAGRFPSESSRRVTGWPAMPPFPTEQVIWNLSGETWADYYRASCRFSPLVSARNIGGFYGETAHPAGWSQWRPDWPTAREADLMIWAWQQLRIMNEATEERAAGIARRIAGPTDRFLFAARCGRKELLAAWSQDRALLGLVSSDALMQAVYALQRAPGQAREEAAIVIAGEMARRLDVNGLDLIRSMAVFAQHAPPGMIQEMQARALNPVLMKSLGTNSDPADQAMRDHWQSNLVRTIPHPLHGLPVCPSVERFRVLAGLLKLPLDNTRSFQGTSLQMVADEFFGGEAFFDGGARSPELLRAVASFPTAHPLKWQIDRWDTLRRAYKLGGESLEGRLTGSDRGTEDQQNAGLVLALREFAEEEQSQLSWHLVRAMLEPKPTKRALLLDLVKTRSPLSTGLAEFDPVASPQGRAAGKPAPVLADPQKPFPVSPPP